MMKKILIGTTVVLALAATACNGSQKQGTCRILGTVTSEQLEGKKIFLVPNVGPATMETVDSVVIKDGRFEFTTDTVMMAKILLDYHFRMGTQPLLVVTEPGQVTVTIGENSSAGGTQQNDSLQRWKQVTEAFNKERAAYWRQARELTDSIQIRQIQAKVDSVYLSYKRYTRQLAENMKEGLLHDFLLGLYPLTFQKRLPDGKVVTVDADTQEVIQ